MTYSLKLIYLKWAGRIRIILSIFHYQGTKHTFYKHPFSKGLCQFTDTIININLQNSFADIVDREQNTVLNTLNPHSPSAAYLELLCREDVVILC